MKRILKNCIIDDTFTKIEYKKYKAYLKGFIFIDGFKAGEESIKKILDEFEINTKIPFIKLRGAYSIIIEIENKDEVYAFTDNSNQNCMFYYKQYLSNRFDYLRDVLGKDIRWNDTAVCEYLSLGKVLFDKTFIENIFILNSEQYVVCNGNELEIYDKGIGKIYDSIEGFDPIYFFKNVAHALNDEKYVNALTGGYDSRLVTVLLNKWGSVYPMICSNIPNNPEEKTSRKVCNSLKKELNVIKIPKPSIKEKEIKKLLELDDVAPFDFDGNYVQSCFKMKMQQEGRDLFITGDGGVLHKDWEWMQDFPFYHKKHTNLERFYKQRIEYIDYSDALGEKLLGVYSVQKERIIEKMKEYLRGTNTESYDCLYYYITGNRRLYYNLTESNVKMYAPLTEFEYVQYSYHLPRRKRSFNNEIRRLTTETNKYVARIPTNYGTTASNEIRYLFRDIIFQSIDCFKKAIRLVGRKFFNKNLLIGKIHDWKFDDLRKMEYTSKALLFAQKKGFISKYVSIDTIHLELLYRVVHLYNIYEKMFID